MLTFVLRPFRKDITEATAATAGSVNIKFVFNNPEDAGYKPIDKVNIALNVKDAVGSAIPAKDFTAFSNYSGTGLTRVQCVEYTKPATPGVYTFEAKLYRGAEELPITVSDLVIVDPANVTSAVIKLEEDYKVPPRAPTNLRVKYIRPADNADKYDVEFSWNDNSKVETKYVLVVYNDDGTIFKTYDTIAANVTTQKVEGLELTKQYTATIRAENSVGKSADTTFDDNLHNDKIHLARVTYHLEKGVAVDEPVASNPKAIETKTTGTAPIVTTGIGYYTVQASDIELPGEKKLPYVFRPFNAGGGMKLYTLDGWCVGNTVPATLTKVDKIPAGNTDSKEFVAIWTEINDTAIEFPSYIDNNNLHIEGENNYIPATVDTALTLTAKVVPATNYKIGSAEWRIDGNVQTGEVNNDTGTVQTSTLKKTFTTTDKGIRRVNLIVTLVDSRGSSGTPLPAQTVSTYCYVKVQ